MRAAIWIGAAALLVGIGGTAGAASIERDVLASKLHLTTATLSAGFSYKISTYALSPGGDTVVHVQNTTAGNAFLAGNDDCGGVELRSCVTIPSATSIRTVQIVVRSYALPSTGNGFLKIERCAANGTGCVQVQNEFMTEYAGAMVFTGNLPVGTRLTTVRQAVGNKPTAIDTVMLVRAGKERGIAFDDEGGLESLPETTYGMSMAQIAEACNGCWVTIGTYTGTPVGRVSLVVDEAPNQDLDGDGASNALEAGIGTAADRADTDEDGLLDGEEVFGARNGSAILQFPYWGANPRHKDMFVEVDWEQGPAGSPNAYQPPAEVIEQVVATYAANDPGNHALNWDGVGGINVHFDSGLAGQTNLHGTWGGASAVPAYAGCGTLSSGRNGYFHHIHASKDGTGQAGIGACVNVQYGNGHNMAHELGHNLYLNHSGLYSAVANCNPLYRSLMSYAGPTQFSSGQYAAIGLNPTQINERIAVPGGVGWLHAGPFWFGVDESRNWVDWNRDGRYDESARGAPNFIAHPGCEIAMPHRSDFGNNDGRTYTSAFVGRFTSSVYLFTVTSSGALEHRRAGSLTDCDPSSWGSQCPGSWSIPVRVPDAVADGTGDTVQMVHPSTLQPMLAVVYKARNAARTDETLTYQTTTGQSWSAPRPVHPTAIVKSGLTEPTLVNIDGEILLFAPLADGRLHEYQYDIAGDSWRENGPVMLDGSPFQMGWEDGIGVVAGYQRWGNAWSHYVFGVYVDPLDFKISLVRRAADRSWSRVLVNGPQRVPSSDVPRLAYTPFDPSVPWDGRFTMVFRRGGALNTGMMITEGNDWQGVDHRLFQFVPIVADPLNEWAQSIDAYSLLSDPDGLRGSMVGPGGVSFYPFFDGVYNAPQKDLADFDVLGAQLDCSLRCPAAPNPWFPDRCCPEGVSGFNQDYDCDRSGLEPTCTYSTSSH